jgi:hypothetical protein
MLVILAAMRQLPRIILYVFAGIVLIQCSRKTPIPPKSDTRAAVIALAPFLQQILHSQQEQPVYYYAPDSLYLLAALTNSGYQVQLMATEENINRLSNMPEFEGSVSNMVVLAPTGLKAGTQLPGTILFDRPLSQFQPDYLDLLLSQSMAILPSGGRIILLQTKKQSQAAQKQTATLREKTAFSRSITDSTHSTVFDLLILEK